MKLLEISGCNLASLKGEFHIALDQPPFSRDGLFAIRGVTGSGKSTLIDAMCLALYDATPRFTGRGGPEIGLPDQKDRLRATDSRSILHRGTAQGWAQVVFRGVDGARWRSRWSVARARKKADGKFQPQEMELENLDTQERFGGTRTEVLEHIRRKVGLSFEQFRRSVLLAQGEFAAFVKADPDERANLLEAMTGTNIYARISVATQKRSAQEEQKLRELHLRREGLGILSPEARGEKEGTANQLELQIREQELDQAALQGQLAWHQQNAKLELQCVEAAAKTAEAQATFEGAEARRVELQQIEQAQPLRPLHVELARSRAQLQGLEGQIQDQEARLPEAEASRSRLDLAFQVQQEALRDTLEAIDRAKPQLDAARALDVRLQEAQTQGSQLLQEAQGLEGTALLAEQDLAASLLEEQRLSTALETVARELEASRGLQSLTQSWPRVQQDLRDFAEARTTLGHAEKALGEAQRKATHQGQNRRALQDDLDEKLAALSAQREVLKALVERMSEEPRAALDAARKNNQGALDQRRSAIALLQRLHPLLAQLRAAEAEALEQTSAGAQARREMLEAGAQLPALEGGLREAKATLELAQTALSLEDRRQHLVSGEPCPLCGSPEHPWAQGSPLAGLLEAQTTQVAALERRRDALEQARTRAQTQLVQAEKGGAKALKEAEGLTLSIREEEGAWEALRREVPDLPGDARSPQTQSQLQEEVLDLEETLADLSRREAALLALETQAETLRRQVGEAEDRERTLKEQLQVLDQDLQRLALQEGGHLRDIAHLEATLQALRATLAAVLDQEACQELDRDPGGLGTRLALGVAARQRAETAQGELSQRAVDTARTLAERRATASERRAAATASEAKRIEAEEAFRNLQTQRQGYFEGRSVLEIEGAQAAERKACEADQHRALGAFQAADRALAELRQTIATLQDQRSQAQSSQESARLAFEEALAQRWGRGLEALEACLAWEPERIQLERAALQDLAAECSKTEAILLEYRTALEAHRALAGPAQSQEELETLAATLKAALEEWQRALGGLQADLVRDDQARQNAEALALEILGQEAVARLWKELNDLVGSADGKKFRTFAQSLTLEALLTLANEQLSRLNRRYRLQRIPGCELEIQIIDQDMGDEIRAINSLSGGETFLVSLAMALGLSALSASDTPIESLFIDEGFGTLDSETLETALSVLDELQSQGRQVGIISHVDGLATHIPIQLQVVKLGGGRSRVVYP